MPSLPNHDTELLNVLQAIGAADTKSVVGTLASEEEPTEELETTTEPDVAQTQSTPPPPTNVTPRTLFSHPDAHPITLDLALLARFGGEWIEWEPETVHLETQRAFGALSDLNFSKIMAMKTLHLVDSPWTQWEIFNWCCSSLNALFPDFELMQVPTPAMTMVAVDISNRVREDVSWSEEVRLFIGKAHEHDGLFVAQPPLDGIAIIDTRDSGIDIEAVKAAWPAVRVSGRAPTEQTTEAEQLRRMLTSFEFLTESRTRLRSQIHLVQNA